MQDKSHAVPIYPSVFLSEELLVLLGSRDAHISVDCNQRHGLQRDCYECQKADSLE